MRKPIPTGEVVAIDSAGYGPIDITQSVSIVAPLGVHAGISVFTGTGVTVTVPSGTVVLRNLFINAQGGTTGVDLVHARNLRLQHCTVSGFSSNGVNLTPTTDSTVSISDSSVRFGSQSGIYANGPSLVVSIVGCDLSSNLYGVVADRAGVSVRDTVANRSLHTAYYARGAGSAAKFAMSDCSSIESLYGFVAENGALTAHRSSAWRAGRFRGKHRHSAARAAYL